MNTSHPLSAVAIAALLLGAASCAAPDRPLPESDADSTAVAPAKPDSAAADTVAAVDSAAIKLEEAKSFRTTDLSAFMLHGHVKTLAEKDGEVTMTYRFSKDGVLTSVSCSEGDQYHCKIKRSKNKISLTFSNPDDPYGGWYYNYVVDSEGRLVAEEFDGATLAFSNYNEQGWPTRSSADPTISYSALDEYGNWTKKSGIRRTISYYPAQ